MTTSYSPPTATPNQLRWPWFVAGGLTLLLLIGAGVVAFLLLHSERDSHAEAACSLLKQSDDQGVLDGAISGMKAISEAEKSSVDSLRAAAATESIASKMPFNSPLYQNPGDVKVAAIGSWCKSHR